MSGSEIFGMGFVIIGMINFARLVLGQDLRALDWSERLGRSLLAASGICIGAAALAPSGAISRNVLGGLGVLLLGASVVQFVVQRHRERQPGR
jgi:hypothetical protein